MNALNAISPIDGRYRNKVEPLADFFSECALIRYRLRVEVEYFIALNEQLHFTTGGWEESLRDVYRQFDETGAAEVKETEKTTNHDVKSVEYYLKRRMDDLGLAAYKEFVHFGLTSQDVNNTAVPLSMRECHEQVLRPAYGRVLALLEERAKEWAQVPMLAHTHGQPASPTTLGKEMAVFAYRLRRQLQQLDALPFEAKFGGATGNFNAHRVAYPDVDWRAFGNSFVSQRLGLMRQQYTTQIENYLQYGTRHRR